MQLKDQYFGPWTLYLSFGTCHEVNIIHKSGAPLRPIVSAIGSYSHNLAKYLTGIIKPYANNEYTVKDSFSFVNELLCFPSVPFMCSFDIVSLFTNIPINETIEICLDKLYKDRLLVENMKRAQLKKLLLYCVKQNHFMFKDSLYDQIDGVSMGSPLDLFWPTFLYHI